MKFSTKGRYGLRALIDLAVHANGSHVSVIQIAERQGVSMNYLEQVFSVMRKANIVKSIKGAQGGYVLQKKPEDLLVGDLLRILEGDINLVELEQNETSDSMSILRRCLYQHVWNPMTNRLNELLDSMTLEDLAEEYRQLNGLSEPIYYI